ncbi:CU044_2847 family protein [Sphaerisporangium dianthi]|uniref:CU044_2847 family protein n=1 Tax=Sphaerisporangium dianthi TaxID=1436120 RepID=A0ABV9CVY0_9ACTN
MTELVRISLDNGGTVVAEVDRSDIPSDSVVLAAVEPGRAVAHVSRVLEGSLQSIRPAIAGLIDVLKDSGPDTVAVEFGIKLGGETGVILAKGTAEVTFKVNLEWRRSAGEAEAHAGETGEES